MEIRLTAQESEKIFHHALCNEGGAFRGADCEITWSNTNYKKAKSKIQKLVDKGEIPHFVYWASYDKKEGKKPTVCFEDVIMQMLLDGGSLKLIDHNGGDYNRTITIKEIHERVQKSPVNCIMSLNEGGDGGDMWTAFSVLQTVFFEEEIFG